MVQSIGPCALYTTRLYIVNWLAIIYTGCAVIGFIGAHGHIAMLFITGIIDADHNGNGLYDAPSTDHAWRLAFNSSTGNEKLHFQ